MARNNDDAGSIQGIRVSKVAPNDTEVLAYDAASNSYIPGAGGGGSGLPFTTATDPALNAAVTTAIIDIQGGVIITLTGAGNNQTLQAPTDTTAGKIFTVGNANSSTNSITVIGGLQITIKPGDAQSYVWDGAAWTIGSAAFDGSNVQVLRQAGTSHTVQDVQNIGHSVGVVSAANIDNIVISSVTAGAVDTIAFSAYFRQGSTSITPLQYFEIPAQTAIATTINTNGFIVANYNGGSPVIQFSLTDTSNGTSIVFLALVQNIGGVIHAVVNYPDRFNDHAHIMNRRNFELGKVQHVSGASMGQGVTPFSVTVSTGKWWLRNTPYTTNATPFDSSGADTFWTYYFNGTVWIETAGQSILSNTQYNSGTGLATLTNNRWGYHDVYVGISDGDIRILYGQGQFTSEAAAEVAPTSPSFPLQIGDIAYKFIGRYTFQKNAANLSQALSAFTTGFQAGTTTSHSSLSDLVNDDHAQYLLTDGTRGIDITQTAHGLIVGNTIKFDGTNYIKAQADSAANSNALGVVSAVVDVNNFTYIKSQGVVTLSTVEWDAVAGTTGGLTSGTNYFLDSATAGLITATEPSLQGQVSLPVLQALSATTATVDVLRGAVIGGGTSFSQQFTNATLVAGVLTITHNFGSQFVGIHVYDNTNQEIIPDSVTATSTTQSAIDLSTYGTITGTWTLIAFDQGAVTAAEANVVKEIKEVTYAGGAGVASNFTFISNTIDVQPGDKLYISLSTHIASGTSNWTVDGYVDVTATLGTSSSNKSFNSGSSNTIVTGGNKINMTHTHTVDVAETLTVGCRFQYFGGSGTFFPASNVSNCLAVLTIIKY